MVLAAYRAEHPDDLAPVEETLEEYDAYCSDTCEAELQARAQELGTALDDFSRAMLVFFADPPLEGTPAAGTWTRPVSA